MDMDATLKNLPLAPDVIRKALEEVGAVSLDDGVAFEVGAITEIREDDIYGRIPSGVSRDVRRVANSVNDRYIRRRRDDARRDTT